MFADDPPSMNQAGNPAQDGKADVDEQIGAAPALEEDGQRRDKDSDEVVDNIGR